MAAKNEILYRRATAQDLPSLSTLVPRSFHHINPFMRQLLPDTPRMRTWWQQVFTTEISNPQSHVLVAVDPVPPSFPEKHIIGCVQLYPVTNATPLGGLLINHPATPDHDAELWAMVMEASPRDEQRVVGGREHYTIEVMAVDQAYQGRGVGKKLMHWACDVADEAGWPIFLHTSQARGFYEKLGRGFVVAIDEEEGDGGRNVALVREAQRKSAI